MWWCWSVVVGVLACNREDLFNCAFAWCGLWFVVVRLSNSLLFAHTSTSEPCVQHTVTTHYTHNWVVIKSTKTFLHHQLVLFAIINTLHLILAVSASPSSTLISSFPLANTHVVMDGVGNCCISCCSQQLDRHSPT